MRGGDGGPRAVERALQALGDVRVGEIRGGGGSRAAVHEHRVRGSALERVGVDPVGEIRGVGGVGAAEAAVVERRVTGRAEGLVRHSAVRAGRVVVEEVGHATI